MIRSATSAIIVALLCVPAFPPPARAVPNEEEIESLILQLAHERFTVREKATTELLKIGWPARPALRRALRSNDPEAVRRARHIFEKQKGSLPPGTSAEVAEMLAKAREDGLYPSGCFEQLFSKYGEGYVLLSDLLVSEENSRERRSLLDRFEPDIPMLAAYLLAEGKDVEAEELMEMSVNALTFDRSPKDVELVFSHYAALLVLRPRLPVKIAALQERLNRGADWHAAALLAYIHRARGDFKAARKAAEKATRDELLLHIRMEQEDWAALAAMPRREFPRDRAWEDLDNFSRKAAFLRLAQKHEKANKLIDLVRKTPIKVDDNGKSSLPEAVAAALLLNDRPAGEVLALLTGLSDLRRFELLCAQLRFKEALALDKKPGTVATWLKLSHARALSRLGERTQVTERLEAFFTALTKTDSAGMFELLLEAENRMGLRDLAISHCERTMARFDGMKKNDRNNRLPDPEWLARHAFNEPSRETAEFWWLYFSRKNTTKAALEKVRDVLDGKIQGKQLSVVLHEAEPVFQTLRQFNGEDEWRKALAQAADSGDSVELTQEYGEKWASASEGDYHRDAFYFLADRACRDRNWREASRRYRQAWERNPTDARAYYLHGWAQEQAGEKEEGQRRMKRATDLALADPAKHLEFGKELIRRGKPYDAEREFERVVRGSSLANYFDLSEALAHLGRVAALRGEHFKAAAYHQRVCLQCLESNLGEIATGLYLILPHRVHRELALGHLLAGRTEEARKEIRICLELLPGNLDLPIAIVPALEVKGLKADADRLFEAVFDLHERLVADFPNCAWAYHNLAWLAVRCSRQMDRALKAATRAVELEPANAMYLDTLAEVYFRQGNRATALKRIEECLAREPGSVYFAKQLVRMKAGDPKAALPVEVAWVKKTEEACVLSRDLFSSGRSSRGMLRHGGGSLNIAPNSYFP